MGLDDKKKKKIGNILALSAVAPSAIMGQIVSAVKESNNSTSWSLWGLFNSGKNKLWSIWSAVSSVFTSVLLKFGYGTESYIKKSEQDMNIKEDFEKARYLAYGKLFDLDKFAKDKVKVKDEERLSKIEGYSGEISNKVSEYESKIRSYMHGKYERLENNYHYEYDKYDGKNWELDNDYYYNGKYNGYQKSWPAEVQEKFEEYLRKIDINGTFYGTKVVDLVKHIRVLCECIVYGDEAADKDIKKLKGDLTGHLKKSRKADDLLEKCIVGEHAIANGWALLKNKLRHRIESCIDLIESYYKLKNQKENFEKNAIRKGLISNLPGRFNEEEKFEEVYYGKKLKDFYEQHTDFKSRLQLETNVPHNIEFNKNIIDESTSIKISEAVEELGKKKAENAQFEKEISEYVEKYNKAMQERLGKQENEIEELLKSGKEYSTKMRNMNINNNNFNNYVDQSEDNIDNELPSEDEVNNNQAIDNNNELDYLPKEGELEEQRKNNEKQEKIFEIIIFNKFGLLEEQNGETKKSLSEIEKIGNDILSYSKKKANEYNDFGSPLFKTTWPKEIQEPFFENINLLRKSFESKEKEFNLLNHIEKLCKTIAVGDIEAEQKIEKENDYLKKRLISRSWGLKKAELYFGIRACIHTIENNLKLELINNKDEEDKIFASIFTIKNSIPGRFNSEDFSLKSYYHYGNDENILIKLINDAARKKCLDIFKDENVVGKETAQIIKNNANFYPEPFLAQNFELENF